MKVLKIEKAYSYDDIFLRPKFSTVKSRLDADISSKLNSISLKVPIIASPMDTVIDASNMMKFYENGVMAPLHRFYDKETYVARYLSVFNNFSTEKFNKTFPQLQFPIVIGTSDEELLKIDEINVAMLTKYSELESFHVLIDVANGHNIAVGNMIKKLQANFSQSCIITAGNVATADGYKYLNDLGVNAVRVGIGSGQICTTRLQTGIGIPVLQSIFDINNVRQKYKTSAAIIADGGIRYPGDVCKAIAAGADAVMVGRLFGQTSDAPGKSFLQNGILSKEYRGMASAAAQGSLKEGTCAEGVSTTIPVVGTIKSVVDDVCGGLRSSFSYLNARNISQYREAAEFVEMSPAGLSESHAYGTRNNL